LRDRLGLPIMVAYGIGVGRINAFCTGDYRKDLIVDSTLQVYRQFII